MMPVSMEWMDTLARKAASLFLPILLTLDCKRYASVGSSYFNGNNISSDEVGTAMGSKINPPIHYP